MRLEYTEAEEARLRHTEITAILENNLYDGPEEEQELIRERELLEAQMC